LKSILELSRPLNGQAGAAFPFSPILELHTQKYGKVFSMGRQVQPVPSHPSWSSIFEFNPGAPHLKIWQSVFHGQAGAACCFSSILEIHP